MSSPVAAAPSPTTSRPTHTAQNYWLWFGGIFSLAFAVMQISGIWWSKKMIEYLGGPGEMKRDHFGEYAALCLVVGVLAIVAGLYALSGAGRLRKLPLLRTGLIAIAVVYLLRGLLVIPQAPIIARHPELARFLWFSVISLVLGAAHLLGVIQLYRRERPAD